MTPDSILTNPAPSGAARPLPVACPCRLADNPCPPRSRTVATRLSGKLTGRLTGASALTGLPASDLLRIGLRRLLAGIERDGFLRAGPKAEEDEAGGAVLKIPPALRSQIRDLAAEHGQSAGEMAAMLLACGIGKLRGGQASVAVPGLHDG